MAITGTERKIDSGLRDNLQTTMSSDAYVSAVGVSKNPSGYAGIKPDFLTKLNEALDNYIGDINKELNKLETNPNIKQAFRGPETEAAVKKLITAVKNEANAYSDALKAAEKSIVQQVYDLYAAQSASIGSSMDADTSKLGS